MSFAFFYLCSTKSLTPSVKDGYMRFKGTFDGIKLPSSLWHLYQLSNFDKQQIFRQKIFSSPDLYSYHLPSLSCILSFHHRASGCLLHIISLRPCKGVDGQSPENADIPWKRMLLKGLVPHLPMLKNIMQLRHDSTKYAAVEKVF